MTEDKLSQVENPWSALPREAPFVLRDDQAHVEAFNAGADDRNCLDLSVLPQPFLGNHRANLVILSRNPGERGWSTGAYAETLDEEIRSGDGSHVPPLLPQFIEKEEGRWWARCFRPVIAELGRDSAWLSERVLAIEFLGYHSKGYRAMPITLPSQRYGFWLLEEAVSRHATIVITRGGRDWQVAVPSLRGADPIALNNPRSATISPGNCAAGDFERVLAALG